MDFDERLDGCVVCHRPLSAFDEAAYEGMHLRYDACPACGLVQMNPRPTHDALARYYEDEFWAGVGTEDRSNTTDVQVRRARQQREFAGRQPVRHLDVGCSMGHLLLEFGGAAKVGIEPGAEHRARASEAGIEVHGSIDDLLATSPEPFDLITMSQVLEHIADPVAELAKLRPLVAPGGRLLVEVPHLYRSHAYEAAHLLAFTPSSLATTLRAAGFHPTDTRLHEVRQGGLGPGRSIAVLAAAAPPDAAEARASLPADQHLSVRAMQARRLVGFAPQRFYRWRHRQQRRLQRHLRRATRG